MDNAVATKAGKDGRREEILEAAFHEFAEKGYSGASMEAIARRARASKETLYAWFESKEKLFNTIYEARLARVGNDAEAALKIDPSPAHVLPVIARDIIKLIIAIAPLTKAAFTASDTSQPLTRQIGNTVMEGRSNLVLYLEWCRSEGYIAFDDSPFEIASIFVAMAQGEWGLKLSTGMADLITDAAIESHAQLVTRLFLKALAPDRKKQASPATI